MVKNSLIKKPGEEEEKTISTYFMKDLVKKKIVEMVGNTNAQKFMTSIISAVSTNPGLQECDYGSIVSATLLEETLKLSPSPQLGQFYMVPYNCKVGTDEKGQNVYVKKAQFQMGYKGYIQLMKRSGQYERINVVAIKKGELISHNPLTEDIEVNFIADEEEREKAETIGYYVMFKEKSGFIKQIYWSKKKMLLHADKYSQAFSKDAYEKLQAGKIPQKDLWKYSSFWYKDFDEMAYKTMLRHIISKWATLSIDYIENDRLQEAYIKDMAVINDNGTYDYVDNDTTKPIVIDNTESTPNESESNLSNDNTSDSKKLPKEEKKTTKKESSKKEIQEKFEEMEIVPPEEDNYEDPFSFLN